MGKSFKLLQNRNLFKSLYSLVLYIFVYYEGEAEIKLLYLNGVVA
jgi:hypothetical protein